MVNGASSLFFKASRSLRQSDFLSFPLFIVVMEVQNKMLLRTRDMELKGLKVGEDKQMEEVTHLFFTDYTLVLCELEERIMLNLKCILLSFQVVSILNINLAKSELMSWVVGGMLSI